MRPPLTGTLLLLTISSASTIAIAGEALTIYSSAQPGAISPEQYKPGSGVSVPGYAMVRHERSMALTSGRNRVRFSDVAAQIDPTTVSFESLTDPVNTRVIEQNYQFDLVNAPRLLDKYIDREISVDQHRANGTQTFTGTLSSTAGGLILRNKDGSVQILNGYTGVKLPEIPGGLITKPTLVWDIAAQKEATHKTRVTYQTGGITWWTDYNFTYTEGKEGACELDVGAWVSILNQSGATYTDAKLKLIAGDVQRAPQPAAYPARMEMRTMAKMADAPATFEEKSFFEYHLYTLSFPTTIPENSTKQLELFPVARNVACKKSLVYLGQGEGFRTYGGLITDRGYGVTDNTKVDVYLSLKNTNANHLGVPLPAGRVRVSKLDTADSTLEFIGENVIDHTAKDESVLIKLGSAFDVVGERKQVNFRIDTSAKWMEEDIEIKLRNRKNEPVTVQVRENLYRWTNWSVIRKSQEFEKQDSRNIQFPVKIAKGGEAIVKYTVRYSW
ncbi:MAG TPA: hypothetical protein VM532_12685 [Burkholderiales bacterium]|nr:hypothetical protein [Burkholderiales bacterium]